MGGVREETIEEVMVMKLAICSTGEGLNSAVEMRFGRTPFFVLVDLKRDEVESVENPGSGAVGGAGPKTVQFLVDQGVDVVLAGKIGPKAERALKGAGMEVYLFSEGRVEKALEAYKEDGLKPHSF